MNKYESVIILTTAVAEEEKNVIIEKIKELIALNNGSILKIESLGKKKLAYEVKKNKEGIYIVIEFEVKPEAISELERYYRINEKIIKFLTISKNED